MNKILFVAACLLCLVGTASAYQLYLSCPETVQVGIPLKCSVDSNLPAGTTFDVVMYQSGYTATSISRSTVTVQENHATMYQLFDTKGLPGGQYKVEVEFSGTEEEKLSSDSVTWQLPKVLDRSSDITITSPLTQPLDEALRIEGSVIKLGSAGVQIEVRGPDGRIFGPTYIATKTDLRSDSGAFTQKVTVSRAGEYDVYFSDREGFIGLKTFTVTAPPTTSMTPLPTTRTATPQPTTTVPSTPPPTTKSPLSLVTVAAALGCTALWAVLKARK